MFFKAMEALYHNTFPKHMLAVIQMSFECSDFNVHCTLLLLVLFWPRTMDKCIASVAASQLTITFITFRGYLWFTCLSIGVFLWCRLIYWIWKLTMTWIQQQMARSVVTRRHRKWRPSVRIISRSSSLTRFYYAKLYGLYNRTEAF